MNIFFFFHFRLNILDLCSIVITGSKFQFFSILIWSCFVWIEAGLIIAWTFAAVSFGLKLVLLLLGRLIITRLRRSSTSMWIPSGQTTKRRKWVSVCVDLSLHCPNEFNRLLANVWYFFVTFVWFTIVISNSTTTTINRQKP